MAESESSFDLEDGGGDAAVEEEEEAYDDAEFAADTAAGVDDDEDEDFADLVDEDEDFAEEPPAKKAKTASKAKGKKSPANSKAAESPKRKTPAKKAPAAAATPAGKKAPAAAPKAAQGGGKAKAAAKATISEKEADNVVLDYMQRQNRPYSAINVFDNLHKRVKKAHVVRVLDKLAARGDLVCKTYGKSKVYYPRQDQFAEVKQGQLEGMDAEIKSKTEEQRALASETQALEAKVKSLSAALPTSQAVEETEAMNNEANEVQARLTKIAESGVKVSPKAREALVKKAKRFKKEWKSRKQRCMDLVDMVADGMEKKLKKFVSELELETDEDVGADINQVQI